MTSDKKFKVQGPKSYIKSLLNCFIETLGSEIKLFFTTDGACETSF